jgi:L-asparaginase/Glu-tRNA(Gln) amidotransferase subunit D
MLKGVVVMVATAILQAVARQKTVRRQFNAHNSPHTIHRGTIHCAQFTVLNSPRTIHRAQFTAAQFTPAQFTMHNSPCTIHRVQYTAHNSPHTIRRSTIHRAKLFTTKK